MIVFCILVDPCSDDALQECGIYQGPHVAEEENAVCGICGRQSGLCETPYAPGSCILHGRTGRIQTTASQMGTVSSELAAFVENGAFNLKLKLFLK